MTDTDPAFEAPDKPDEFPVFNADNKTNQVDQEKLLHLLRMYDRAEAEAGEAAKQFEAIKAALKTQLFELRPDETDRRIELRSQHLHAPLRMIYVEGRKTLNREALNRDHPYLVPIFEDYTKTGKPSWTLRRVKQGEE